MKRNLRHTIATTASLVLLTALSLCAGTQRAPAQGGAAGPDSNRSPVSASARWAEPPKFQAAREALSGSQKDPVRAKALLLEVVGPDRASVQAEVLCYAYVYLGYIEDRAGNRQEAIQWYNQALAIQEAGEGIRQCAVFGLKQPLTWIRHLDQASTPAAFAQRQPPANGYVTNGAAPTGYSPAKILSAKEQRQNLDFLCQAIDETYADFELKAIDWGGVCHRYQARLDPAGGADDFYRLVFQLVNELKDTHSWLDNYHVDQPANEPELTVALVEGKPFVVVVNAGSEPARQGVKPGSEVLEVDGVPVADKIEQLRPQLRAFSTERAYRHEACRCLLAGARDSEVKVKLRLPDGQAQTFALRRTGWVGNPPPQPCAFDLTPGHFVQFGHHPSGMGYIRITSFLSHEEVGAEFNQALEALRTAPGLILDIRDNPGGFGQDQAVGRLLQRPTVCAVTFVRNGPRHGDLDRHETRLEPTGSWQYGGPIALLVNEGTGSAADLFACELRSAKRVVTVGATTHGNLSGVAAYAVLPCGLVVRISNGYICDAFGKPIEGVGNEPDVPVSPSIGDVLAGRDPALERAAALLGEKARGS